MFEVLLTITIIGLTAGFIFSIPVAGPVNLVITSNALSGKLRFCIRTGLGASIIEFFYVVIIVYGISSLYSFYKPFIPYLLLAGSVILIIVGIKIIKTKLNLDNPHGKTVIKDKLKNKGGFRTGILINLTNPSLFLGWLTSTFIVFSFVSSLGINTGGLDLIINENVTSLKEIAPSEFEKLEELTNNFQNPIDNGQDNDQALHPILLGLTYGIALSIGSFIWLYLYSKFIVKYRKKLNVNLLNRIIQSLGVVLCLLSIYLIYKAIVLLSA